MKDRRLILLAPARDKEVAKAAVQAGADAIYIGAPKFGARQAAGNSMEDLAETVVYAHRYGVQVLVTLNTLLNDDERKQAAQMAHQLYQAGADALIIQDLRLLNEPLPPIRLHASTQCDNRTPEQVIRLAQMGFKRIVLARELSLIQIKQIADRLQDAGIEVELEAFIHGALCVCYSGRCYMSEELLGRSANRGCCAQMCRMRYDLLDEDGKEIIDDEGKPIHQRYVLSLQDMDRSGQLKALIEAGVTTFKIEGRLKDQAYVTNVVAYYRQLLDRLITENGWQRGSEGVYRYSFEPNPEKTFHRGQTDYFMNGRTRPIANWDTPKSTGEKITDLRQLHPGDGIAIGDQGFLVNGVENGRIKTNHPVSILPGAVLYRNLDNEFLKSLKAERRIPVDILFEATTTGYKMVIQHARSKSERQWECAHQKAEHGDKALKSIIEQVSKLGDTPFIARSVRVRYLLPDGKYQDATQSFPYFIPISQLNAWRRTVIADL